MNTGIKAWDKLFYLGTNIFINKPNIQIKEQLKKYEEANTFEKMRNLNNIDIQNHIFQDEFSINSLKRLHKFLLGDIYSWGGTFKEVPLYKSQDILGCAFVQYCER